MNCYESIRKPLLLSVFLIIQTFRFVSSDLTNEFSFGQVYAHSDKTSGCSLDMLHTFKVIFIHLFVLLKFPPVIDLVQLDRIIIDIRTMDMVWYHSINPST